ncbi:MAG: GTPase Era [Gaiellales bacterium]|nr:GTPase Era [Gaiellales bacterium]
MAEEQPLQGPEPYRSGFVALLGRPNAGKSTLVNRLVGQKVSIVSEKPQTTRRRVAGVVTSTTHQLVLLDIPGFQKPRDELTQRMQHTVNAVLKEIDAAVFLVAGDEQIGKGDAFIAGSAAQTGVPVIVAVNKADMLSPEQRARQLDKARGLGDFESAFVISALTGEGLAELRVALEALLPLGPRYFPGNEVTDQSEEDLIAELIREKALRVTEQDVPHAVSVEVLEMEEREGKDFIYIRAAVFVERSSQRPILLGEGGRRLKEIGSDARRDIEHLLGRRVYLDLVVQVKKHWRRNPGFLGRLGL